MVSRKGTPKGRRAKDTATAGPGQQAAASPGSARNNQDGASTRASEARRQIADQNAPPPPPPAGLAAGVAQIEALVQALSTLPADTRRAITTQLGIPPPATSAASQRYDDERMDSVYANCIQVYIPEELRSEFDAVEWSDVGPLFSKLFQSVPFPGAAQVG